MRCITHFLTLTQLVAVVLFGFLLNAGPAAYAGETVSAKSQFGAVPDGIYRCDSSNKKPTNLNPGQPVALLVHGLNGAPSLLSQFASVLEQRGMQTLCFTYGGRASLKRAARDLARSIETIAEKLDSPKITLIGHSMGGLVARRALITESKEPIDVNADISLVTVASPFSGVRAASPCGYLSLRIVSLGLQDLACWVVSGNKWNQISPSSKFIQQPGTLHPAVSRFLMVKTDEVGSCRRFTRDNNCLRDDFVISYAEQALPDAAGGTQAQQIVLRVGHAAVVGQAGSPPLPLVEAMVRKGLLSSSGMRLAGRTSDNIQGAANDALL